MNYYKKNIRNVKGDTYSFSIACEEKLDSIYFTCKNSLNDNAETLFQKYLDNGISLVDDEKLYNYVIRIAPSDTQNLQSGTFYYDLQIGLNNDIFTIMKGKFIIEQDATKQGAEPYDPELYIKLILDEINGEVIGATVTDKTDYLSETKSLIKENINLTDAGLTNSDTFRSYASKLKNGLINVINNGTDVIFNNLPQVTGEGTSLTLENTINSKIKISLKGNTEQDGTPTPSNPVDVEVVTGNNNINICGKNLCDGINQNVYLNEAVTQCGALSGNSGLYIPVNGGNYTISSTTTQTRYRVACINNVPSVTTQIAYNGVKKDNTNNSITIDTTGYKYLVVNATDLTSIQIEKGPATPYEAYKSQNYEINLKSKNLINKSNPYDYIEIKENTTYTLSGVNSEIITEYTIRVYDENKQSIDLYSSYNRTFTTIATSKYFKFENNCLNSYLNTAQLEEKSQATPYSSYFTPIEFCKIVDYKDEISKSTGKNKIDKTNGTIIQSKYGIDISNLKIGETYTFSSNIPIDTFKISNRHDGYNSVYKHENNQLFSSFTFTMAKNENIPESEAQYLFIKLNSSTWVSSINELANYTIQIEEGSQSTDIEPYGVGIWYKYKEIGKVVLDGSENWEYPNSGDNYTFFQLSNTNFNNKFGNKFRESRYETGILFADNFKNINSEDNNMISNEGIGIKSAYMRISVANTIATTVSDFKTWLSTHNTTVYYILANPAYEIITETQLINQLNNLEEAMSYEEVTNITQNNNDLPFILNVVALKGDEQ